MRWVTTHPTSLLLLQLSALLSGWKWFPPACCCVSGDLKSKPCLRIRGQGARLLPSSPRKKMCQAPCELAPTGGNSLSPGRGATVSHMAGTWGQESQWLGQASGRWRSQDVTLDVLTPGPALLGTRILRFARHLRHFHSGYRRCQPILMSLENPTTGPGTSTPTRLHHAHLPWPGPLHRPCCNLEPELAFLADSPPGWFTLGGGPGYPLLIFLCQYL